MKPETKPNSRWKTCLHEAAHCVIARALNSWDCTTRAYVCEGSGNGGIMHVPAGLTPFKYAVMTAAGDHGGMLPLRPPKRRRRPVVHKKTSTQIEISAMREVNDKLLKTTIKNALPDVDCVAQYCITLHPGDPDEWKAAFERIHAEARRVVFEHRDAINRVAQILYHRGEVIISGNEEDEKFLAALRR